MPEMISNKCGLCGRFFRMPKEAMDAAFKRGRELGCEFALGGGIDTVLRPVGFESVKVKIEVEPIGGDLCPECLPLLGKVVVGEWAARTDELIASGDLEYEKDATLDGLVQE